MQRWDYRVLVLTHGFMGYHKDELDRAEFERNLDALGQEGFDLASVLLNQKLHREKDDHVFIFKRPLPLGADAGTAVEKTTLRS